MTPERWKRTEELYQAARTLPPAERAAFLAEACRDDETLRRDVESLVNEPGSDDGFLREIPIDTAARIVSDFAPGAMSGRPLGGYNLQTLVGAGGMGEVYRASDPKLGRDVAIKILPRAFTSDADRLARFEREARMLAALNHPNVCAIYGLEEAGGVRFLVLELVDGPTLNERLADANRARPGAGGRGLPLSEILMLARQIAEALESAHDKGIVHRDLKPANIKIAPDGRVKVLDFGLAKPADQELSAPGLTQAGQGAILGTASYMSPEQARGKPVDKRADIWGFGCVLYEMLTGRAAFAGDTVSDTIAKILEREPDWEALPRDTPPRLRALLRRCIQKDLSRRLRDIGDARLELEEASAELDSPSADRDPDMALADPVRARLRLPRLVVVGALALLAVAALGYVASFNRSALSPTFRQLTFRHETINGARLAADGQTVVYRAARAGAEPGLFMIRPDSRQSGSIGLDNAGIYSVSPGGELAIARSCRLNWGECLGTLAQVPITGGTPREMVKDVLGADWSPDGRNLAVVSFSGSTYRLEYPLDKVLYEPSGWITSARVSPTADRIAFLDHARLGDTGGSVSIVDLSGRRTTLSSNWKSLQGLAWSADGGEVWFAGSRTGKGASSLYAVTLSGRERAVMSSPGTLTLNDISRDGRRVLLTRGTTRGGIMAAGRDAAKERDLSLFDYSTVADLSADGTMLLFYEWGEGVGARPTIFIRKTDGSDAVRLGEGRPLALSPDGRSVVAIQENPSLQLVLLPVGAGEMKTMPPGPIVEFLDWASWSPDGRRFFFAGREAPDVRRTYVQDIDGGGPRPVTPDGFVGMVLSPDGRTIAAVDRYGEYYLCPTDASAEPRPLAGDRDGDVPLQWSADSRFLFMRTAGNLVLRIDRLNATTGERQFWKELVPPDPTVLIDIGSDPGQIRIAPDGKSYAYTYWTFDGELYLAEGLK